MKHLASASPLVSVCMCVCAGVCVPLRALRASRMASLGPSSRSVRQPKEKLSPNRVRRMSSEGFLKSATAGGVYLVTSIYGTTMKETDADMYIQFEGATWQPREWWNMSFHFRHVIQTFCRTCSLKHASLMSAAGFSAPPLWPLTV